MPHPSRRQFVAWTGTALFGTAASRVSAQQPAAPAKPAPAPKADNLDWYDVESWGVEGRGWPKEAMEKFYHRFPAKAKGVVRDAVWGLSNQSAGLLTRFNTDATEIRARYQVTSATLALPHMPATGVSGIDLYAVDPEGALRWVSVTKPSGGVDQNQIIVNGLDAGLRNYTAYLPLYNGVNKLEIGVPKGAKFEPVAPRVDKPVIFYGTSITHGACASRPGMCHPAILGRRLNRPVLNLGFSGNGKMEKEVGALLAELDPAVYVIDCLPNMVGTEVAERSEPLVRQLRAARPETPIVLVEDRTYGYSWVKQGMSDRHTQARAALKATFDKVVAEGFAKMYYVDGNSLLGKDGDATTDGSHPNDLGFMRQADAMEPALRKALA